MISPTFCLPFFSPSSHYHTEVRGLLSFSYPLPRIRTTNHPSCRRRKLPDLPEVPLHLAQEEMSDWDGIRSEILDTGQENDPIEQEYGEYVTIHDRFQVLTRYPR